MAQNAAQRREMVRVDDKLEISHRPISKAESEALSREIVTRSRRGFETVTRLLESAGRAVDPNSTTWRSIVLLDKKLDYIISLLEGQGRGAESDFVHTEVNISGSGLRFASRQLYKKGDLLWIGMILPAAIPLRAEVVAEVQRVSASVKKRGESPSVEVSTKFIAINPQDREEILRYTFKRQREVLRAKGSR